VPARTLRTNRSANAFARGVDGGVVTTVMNSAANTASKRAGVLRVPVPDQKPHPTGSLGSIIEVHDQVASLLRRPLPGRVGRGTEDVEPAGGHVHDEQYVQPSKGDRVVSRRSSALVSGR
jgi:hypothetical protein